MPKSIALLEPVCSAMTLGNSSVVRGVAQGLVPCLHEPRANGHDPEGSHYMYGIATPSAREQRCCMSLRGALAPKQSGSGVLGLLSAAPPHRDSRVASLPENDRAQGFGAGGDNLRVTLPCLATFRRPACDLFLAQAMTKRLLTRGVSVLSCIHT